MTGTFLLLLHRTWYDIVKNTFESYNERTDGASIEKRESSIVWHYEHTDPDFGTWQANELITHLQSILENFDIQIINGKYYVEVRPKQVKKVNMCQ